MISQFKKNAHISVYLEWRIFEMVINIRWHIPFISFFLEIVQINSRELWHCHFREIKISENKVILNSA